MPSQPFPFATGTANPSHTLMPTTNGTAIHPHVAAASAAVFLAAATLLIAAIFLAAAAVRAATALENTDTPALITLRTEGFLQQAHQTTPTSSISIAMPRTPCREGLQVLLENAPDLQTEGICVPVPAGSAFPRKPQPATHTSQQLQPLLTAPALSCVPAAHSPADAR
mmetsp:Transcript_26607/g.68571  ORF Transcript_26607/g.68571 Transcript_26607/m.68571 type:complete len:168 (+) Transcript_26607:383-886(+)|eukprot:scaffold79147_cov14-Tisochrysis_lutea.AAC.1